MPQPMLFSPLDIRGLRLRNRVVVAPMHQYSAVEGFANDWHLVNAGKFAQGGAGLVIMESTKVARNGAGTVGDVGLWDDQFIPPLARCAAFIKAHGARAGIQLGHSGRKARLSRPWEGGKPLTGDEPGVFDWAGWELVAPSAVPHSERSPTPRALSHNEVRDLAVKWGEAAARADRAGFDVVEIHAAHGYLIHQFLSPLANVRTDEYGGSELNRARFAIEVAECVRAAWPADKPLFMRLSCEDDAGFGPEESVRLSRLLKDKGVDVIDCSSGGTLARSPMDGERSKKYGYQVPYAEKIRREADIKTMAVGHIVHADQAEAILQGGRADLVALAREMLYNPNWPMDAAQKLGIDPDFKLVPPPYSYWLDKRAKSAFEGQPSTWTNGLGSIDTAG
ncbi:MAG: NADH:flavin oxidoreductase/NADH oxidase [Rhizobiales bacterium]|jgi:2,4-dienoyl-CoA reductase-like NADH-dependent reductase (Old Yellow Enzyme family)|nr:NADH:flavin oxidoreductase/NADH oxidase [Hyphomicrobiales bacterium]MBN9011480.1 NADH:flavin oxidoreductase/NADH oxidase [Hyphomicrobiales bacterium]